MAIDGTGTDLTDPALAHMDRRLTDLEAWADQLQDQQNRIVALLQAAGGALSAVVDQDGLPPT